MASNLLSLMPLWTMTLDAAVCYHALRARDARFDGVFFTGVRTTGIYCRPVCPARTPQAQSCQFFATASAAEKAGFRPCLRCRPELAPGIPGSSLAEAILHRLQERAVDGSRLETLETELGLSLRHVRRILESDYGVTPLQVVQTCRLLLAKQMLQETALPISEIALASGFRSLRRFNALFQQRYQLTPGDCRRERSESPLLKQGIRLRLAYRPPLAWDSLLEYFRSRLVPGVEDIQGREYRRTVMLGGASGWIRVWPDESEAFLHIEMAPSLSRHVGAVQARIRRMFDLDARPDLISQTLIADPLLKPVVEGFPGLRIGGAWDVFELSVRAILGQQISVAAATTLSGRLAAKTGGKAVTPFPELHRHALTDDALSRLSVNDLCQLGLVQSRAKALLHLAEASRHGALDFPPGLDHEQAVTQLIGLPGIGPWTAHYIAMRALRFPDAFPAADMGLRKAVGRGVALPAVEVERRSQAWRPWRAYAAAALWKSLTF